MKVALFFGSFNPIHTGHLIIGQHILNHTNHDELWYVVSPQNPDKEKQTLLEDYHRLALVRLAIEDNSNMKASDIEFSLPKPSYTIDTLSYLKEKHPNHSFSIIMGEDNLRTFHKWKNYERILENFELIVYPRLADANEAKSEMEIANNPSVNLLENVPQLNISASHIRRQIEAGKSAKYLLNN